MANWLDGKNGNAHKDILGEIGNFFNDLNSCSKTLDSLVSVYNSSIINFIYGLIKENGDLKAKHHAIVEERDNLLETLKNSCEVGQPKAKLPVAPLIQDDEDHDLDIQSLDSRSSDTQTEVHLDTEEHAEKRDVQDGGQINGSEEEMKINEEFDESLENEETQPQNTQNDVTHPDETTPEQPTRNFKCDRCPYETTLKGHLVRHISRHKSHFCDECPFTATAKDKLRIHKKEVHQRIFYPQEERKDFKCEKCSYRFYRKGTLEKHVKNVHSGSEHKFKCDKCPFKAKQQTKLMSHIEHVHGKTINDVGENVTYNQWGDKHFKCEQCPLTYLKKGTLIRHVKNVHSGSEHKCDQCPFKSKQQEELKSHIEQEHDKTKHDGGDEYGKKATPKAVLNGRTDNVQMRGEFKCEQCPLSYLKKGMLIRHVNNVHFIKDKEH